MGIGTMVREEKAVIYATSQYLTQSPLLPVIEDYDEVQFEVELVHFIQVSKIILTRKSWFITELVCCGGIYISLVRYNMMKNELLIVLSTLPLLSTCS